MKRFLLEYSRGLLQKTSVILEDGATVGRNRQNYICLDDPEASRNHARLFLQNGQYKICDLQSRNGTFVNGRRIKEKILKNGDLVGIGQTTLRFLEEAVEERDLEETVAYADSSEEIQEQMDLVKTFIDALPLGVVIINENLEVRYSNQTSLSLGRTKAFEEGQTLGFLLDCPCLSDTYDKCRRAPGCQGCRLEEAARKVFKEKKATVGLEISWPAGKIASHLRISMLPLPFCLTGEPLAQVTLEDITASVQDHEALQKSRRELEERVEERTAELKNTLRHLEREIGERRSAEKALRQSEEKYRFLVENANEAIFVLQDERLRYVNPKMQELTEFSEKELISSNFMNVVHPDDRAMVLADYQRRLMGEELPESYIFRIVDRFENIRYVELNVVLVSWEGSPATLCFLSDATVRERAIKELSRLSFVVEEMVDGIVITDLQGRVIYVNKAVTELLGYEKEELIGKTAAKFIVEKEMQSFEGLTNEVLGGKPSPKNTEFLTRHKDGSEIPVSINFCALHDTEADYNEIAAVIRDMTGSKQVEKALRENEEKYRQLVEHAPAGIYELDLKDAGRFISVNDVMCEYTGYSKEEFLEKRFLEIVTEESKGKLIERFQKIRQGQRVSDTQEYEAVRKDGNKFWTLINSKLIYEDGEPAKAMVVAHDITERKHLEQQLHQAQKIEAIGRLAGGVAHDFNNILTSVIGHTDLILLNLDPQSPLRVNVQEIKKAGERAAALTRQLLAFSRKQMLQPRVLVLNDVVRDLEAMLRRLIGEDIELKTVLDPNTGKVEADPGQIEQVIMNLAVNARDAMPDGGKLTIETRRVNLDRDYQRNHDVVQPGPYLLLAISDTGSGMDEATQSRIFEPFFTTKELGKGTGLGLATVYGVVKQSGGYIWVYSEPGRGTTFKIYLPTVDAHVEAPADEHAPARPLQGSEVVLVVEDDDTVRNLTRDVLKEYGYRVLEADKGAEAIEVVRAYRDPLHLVVTDVVMPGLSAREMIRRLQSMRPEVKVLYMSGYTESAIVHRGALDRDISFLQKPFTPRELAEKIREVLDGGPTVESASP